MHPLFDRVTKFVTAAPVPAPGICYICINSHRLHLVSRRRKNVRCGTFFWSHFSHFPFSHIYGSVF